MPGDTCLSCSDNFIVNSKFILCTICKYKCHLQCAGLKDDVPKLLVKIKNLKWFCDKCVKNVEQCDNELKRVKRENELLKKIVQDQEYTILAAITELCNAATKIQASFRGHLTRKHEAEKKHDEGSSASKPGEKNDEIDDIDLSDPELNKAAVKIQASFRGHMVRKEHDEELQHNDATK